MLVTVRVTADLIATGHPRDQCWCPLALAIGLHLRPGVEVRVTNGRVFLRDSPGRWPMFWRLGGVRLPYEALWWVAAYDQFYGVDPIEFELEIPARWLKEAREVA